LSQSVLALALALVAARPLAVVPVAAAGMSVGEMQELSSVDEQVRVAAARDGVSVQSKEQTLAALQSARTAGVSCAVGDIACWKRVAVLSEVELVLVCVAAPRADGQLALVVTLVDVAASRSPGRAVDAVPKGRDPESRIRKLIDDVFARGAEAPEPDDTSTPTPAAIEAAPTTPASTSPSFDLAAIPTWGFGAGAAGVGVVVGAAVGVAAAMAVASSPPHKPQLAAPPPPPTSGPAVVQLP
jgi:hypothetical protein